MCTGGAIVIPHVFTKLQVKTSMSSGGSGKFALVSFGQQENWQNVSLS